MCFEKQYTASNYTTVNKPVVHMQMRMPNRLCTEDMAHPRRLDNPCPEADLERSYGWNRDTFSIMGRGKQMMPCRALLC